MKSGSNDKIASQALLATLIVLTVFFGLWRQPSVHYYYDAVGIRDSGLMIIGSLSERGFDWPTFKELLISTLTHVEGPLQFLLLNTLYPLFGNLLGLGPAPTALPNIVLAALSLGLAVKVGEELHGRRFGLAFALAIFSAPWFLIVVRMPWVFNFLSLFLGLLTLHLYLRLERRPESRWYAMLAPCSFGLYLLGCLDWPTYGLFMAVLLLSSPNRLRHLFNPWNIVPLSVIVGWGIVSWKLHLLDSSHAKATILTYPFFKLAAYATFNLESALRFSLASAGMPLFVAVVVTGIAIWRRRSESDPKSAIEITQLDLAMTAWAVVTIIPLLATATDRSYGFVSAIPVAFLAARGIAAAAPKLAMAVIIAMAVHGLWAVADNPLIVDAAKDDRRVLAMAAYLNVERPGLLAADKTAFLPRQLGANVGQYARGENERIVMSSKYISTGEITSIGSPAHVRKAFTDELLRGNRIAADWMVMEKEHLHETEWPRAAEFFQRLAAHPNMSWCAVLYDAQDREIWLGEVDLQGSGKRCAEPVKLKVEEWADIYQSRFDNVGFLSRNLDKIDHY